MNRTWLCTKSTVAGKHPGFVFASTQAHMMPDMDGSPFGVVIGLLYFAIIVALTWRLMRRRKRYGPALTGTIHDLLNEDRRKAIELIVEEKAEARDPEDRDGNLPDLESPR
jgi:hypothetical protein